MADPSRHLSHLPLTECHHFHAAVRTGPKGGIELLDNGGDGLKFFGVARDDEGAAFGVDGDRGSLLGAAKGVVADQRRGQHLRDLLRFGGSDLKHPGGRTLGSHLVELAHQLLDDGEFIGLANDDQAVAAGVRGDGGVRWGAAEAGLGLVEVEAADGRGQFRCGRGDEVDDADIPGVCSRLGRVSAQLLEDGFDLLQMVGTTRDDDASTAGISKNLSVGGIGV